MKRVGSYLDRFVQQWSWLSFSVNLFIVFFVVALMFNTVWMIDGINLGFAWVVAAWAFGLGWVLSRVESRLWMVVLFAFLVGSLLIASQFAQVGDELITAWNEFLIFIKNAYTAWRAETEPPGTFLFMQPLYAYSQGMYNMLTRLGGWLIRLPGSGSDTLALIMAWGMGLWLSIVWITWSVWKKSWVLTGALPGLILAGLAVIAQDGSISPFLFMFGSAIALIVLYSQLMREQEWERNLVGYSEYIREHSTRAAVYLSFALVLGSAFFTSIDYDELIDRIRELRQSNSGSSVGGGSSSSNFIPPDPERMSLAEEFNSLSEGGFPMVNLVGTGPELAEYVIMHVELEEMDPETGNYLPVGPDQGLIYLRSLNYDQYYSQGWFATTEKVYFYEPEQEAIRSYSSHQRLLRQDIDFKNDFTGLLHAVGQLAVADIKYGVAWREGSTLSEFRDMFGARITRGRYQAYSIVPVFGENELRSASVDYPDWIVSRYLDIPNSVPDRVLDLADELTRFEVTSYDKAVAIEQYLRTFPYTLDLPSRPVDQDIVDYFLFDIQKGYCDYYASAMVIMARQAGLPARLAVGYLGINYDEEQQHFVVTADQAHSWVEIYFPEYGWVTFEPTAGRAAIARETVREQTVEFEQTIEFVEEDIPLTTIQIIQLFVGSFFAVGILVIVVFLRVDLWLLRRKQPEVVFATLYRRVQRFGGRLEIPHAITSTPYEFSAAYQDYLENLTTGNSFGRILKPIRDQLNWIFVEYVRAIYSTDPPGVLERARAVREWNKIRRLLALVVAWKKVDEFRQHWQKKS